MKEKPIISVIIPTYKRTEYLLQSIKSLQNQNLDKYEIIVIDNSADNNLLFLIDEFNKTAHVKVRYIPEPQIGLHNARHTGAKASNGEILVFTDDDATFDSNWLKAHLKAFSEHQDMAAAGETCLPYLGIRAS